MSTLWSFHIEIKTGPCIDLQRFPEMWVRPSHLLSIGLSSINHPVLGTPISGNHHICTYMVCKNDCFPGYIVLHFSQGS